MWSGYACDRVLGLFLSAMDWQTRVYLEDGEQDGEALENVIRSVVEDTGEGRLGRNGTAWSKWLQGHHAAEVEDVSPVDPARVELAPQGSLAFHSLQGCPLQWVRLPPQGVSPSPLVERFEPRFGSSSARDSRERILAWRRVWWPIKFVYFSPEFRDDFFALMNACFPIRRQIHTHIHYIVKEQFKYIKNAYFFSK